MVRKIKNNQPTSLDEALYLLDRGKLRVSGARTREAAVAKLTEQWSGDGDEGYGSKSVADLTVIIDERNAERDEDDQIVPEGRKKQDLVDALEADDEDTFLDEDDD